MAENFHTDGVFCVEDVGETVHVADGHIHWRISNLYFKGETEIFVYSPKFLFAGETWRMAVDLLYEKCRQHERLCPLIGVSVWHKLNNLSNSLYDVLLSVIHPTENTFIYCEGAIHPQYGFRNSEFLHRDSFVDMSRNRLVIFSCKITKKAGTISDYKNLGIGYTKKEKGKEAEGKKSSDGDENKTMEKMSTDGPAVKGVDRLIQQLKYLYLEGENSDVLLKVGDREFKAHKLILATRSAAFASMFHHGVAEKEKVTVDIPGCSAAAFEIFLSYLYTGTVDSMTSDNVYDLYYAADKYLVGDLKNDCVVFMKINLKVDTFCDVIALSLRHSELELQEFATYFFNENTGEILKSSQWQRFSTENPTQVTELLLKAQND